MIERYTSNPWILAAFAAIQGENERQQREISKLRSQVEEAQREIERERVWREEERERSWAEEELEWEVSKVLSCRGTGAGTQYLVLWQEGSRTWEPKKNLNCPQLLQEFRGRRKALKAQQRKKNF